MGMESTHTVYRINTYELTEDNNAEDESVIEPSIFFSHGSQEDDSQRHKHQSYWKQGKKKVMSAYRMSAYRMCSLPVTLKTVPKATRDF